MDSSTCLKSLPLKYHGGKQYLASRIVKLFPDDYLHYVEPYFGGGAVLFAHDPEGKSEVVNDIDGELINFWRVLRCPAMFITFKMCCEATPFSEALFESCKKPKDYCNEVGRAWLFFIRCRQSLAGRMKSFAPLTRNRVRRGMNEQAAAWLSAIDGLPAVHARLQRVVILCRDALDVIRCEDGPKTLFCLDPPYLHETRSSKTEYGEREMTEYDHGQLLAELTSIEGRFLLSGYRSQLYDDAAAAAGWTRVDFDLPNNAAGGKSKRRMIECVWMNFSRPLARQAKER